MNTKRRWLTSILKAAKENDVRLPWERGARRQEMIARRHKFLAPSQLRA